MNRNSITVLFTAVVAAAAGGAIGSLLEHLTLGAIIGGLAGMALGAFATTRRRRWLAVGLLSVQIVLAFFVGGGFGLAFTVIAVALTFFIASAVLAELYGGGELEAALSHLRLVLGVIQGLQVVDDTTPVGAQTGKPLFGPRLLIVRAGKAVVLERGAQRRVVHPSITTTAPFEYVRYVYHLGDVQTTHAFMNVLTQDLVSCNVQLTAVYRLTIRPEVRSGADRPNVAEEALLLRLPLSMPNWETALKQVLEQCVRQAVGKQQLEKLLDGSAVDTVELAITNRARTRISGWGITLQQIIVHSISASPEVAAAMEMRRKERERALGMSDALAILADGYKQAQSVGMQQNDVWVEVLRRTLEQIVQQLTTRGAI